jgi:hypothetical protein
VELKGRIMTKDELSAWALRNGFQVIAGDLCLTKPSKPSEAIVRLKLKGTVVQLEIKKPAGKWEKIKSVGYGEIEADEDTGMPRGLGFDTISGFSSLIQDNKLRAVFAKKPEG